MADSFVTEELSDGTLTANLAVVQARIATDCGPGLMIQSVSAAGVPACAIDDGTGRQVVTATDTPIPNVDVAAATASCPAGKIAMGGGALVSVTLATDDDKVALRFSAPVLTGTTGWSAEAFYVVAGPATTWTLSVFAICVSTG